MILLCETWLNPSDYTALKGFVIVRNDRSAGRGGGTAICIRNSLSFNLVDVYNSLNNVESNAISLSTLRGELLVVSTYRPPNTPFDLSYLYRLLASPSHFSIFLAGDLNCLIV